MPTVIHPELGRLPSELAIYLDGNHYKKAFSMAAKYGELPTLLWLEKKVTAEELVEMIALDNYRAFQDAAETQHLSMLGWLIEKLKARPAELTQMFSARADEVLSGNANDDLYLIRYLLSQPDFFSWANLHRRDYGQIVSRFRPN